MEMGVRRAEAARRQASAGRGHQGEWAPHASIKGKAQATRLPPRPAAILPVF